MNRAFRSVRHLKKRFEQDPKGRHKRYKDEFFQPSLKGQKIGQSERHSVDKKSTYNKFGLKVERTDVDYARYYGDPAWKRLEKQKQGEKNEILKAIGRPGEKNSRPTRFEGSEIRGDQLMDAFGVIGFTGATAKPINADKLKSIARQKRELESIIPTLNEKLSELALAHQELVDISIFGVRKLRRDKILVLLKQEKYNKSSHGPVLKLVNHNIRFFNEHVSDHINAEQPFGRKVRVTVVFDWLRRNTELFDESLYVKDISEEQHDSAMAQISELARAQFEFKKEKDNQYKIEKGLEKKQFRMRKQADQILPPDDLVEGNATSDAAFLKSSSVDRPEWFQKDAREEFDENVISFGKNRSLSEFELPMYGSKSSLSSFQSSKFGDDSDDEDISPINRHGFKVKNGVIEDGLNVSIEKNRERESKWLLMLANWNLYSKSKKYQSKLKNRVRKGIPDAIRGKAWMFLSGGEVLKRASLEGKLDDKGTTFKKLDEMSCSADEEEQIEKDLHRQFPDHEMFSTKGSGKQDLYRVLKAWAVYRPDVGYCQGQAPIASLLLMHLTAEDAFWSLVAICDYFIPGYYDVGLTAIQMDGLILESLTGSYCSDVHKLLKATKVESMYYMTDWFMCIFIRTLPWNTVLRVFDLFLSEGVKVLFRVGLTMLRENLYPLSKKLKKNNADDLFMDAMTFAKRSPEAAKNEDYFIRQVCSCRVTERELTNEYQKQKKKWDKTKGDVGRNYFKRDPEGIYSDVKMPYTDGKMSKTINPISADAANVTTASRLTTVHESQEAQEDDINTDERWKGVDSSNYDPNATIRPMPPLKTSAQSIAKPPRSTSAPNKFPDTETKL